MKNFRASVVLPTYNEKENLGVAMREVTKVLGDNLEFVVVDDDSPDGTAQEAALLSKSFEVKLIVRKNRRGIGSALQEGYDNASSGIIVSIDTDLQQETGKLKEMLEMVEGGTEFVQGSRYLHGGSLEGFSFFRKVTSAVANRLVLLLRSSKTPCTEATSNFRAFQKRVLRKVRIESRGFAGVPEFSLKAIKQGFSYKEVPIRFYNRKAGRSKLNVLKEMAGYLAALFSLRLQGKI